MSEHALCVIRGNSVSVKAKSDHVGREGDRFFKLGDNGTPTNKIGASVSPDNQEIPFDYRETIAISFIKGSELEVGKADSLRCHIGYPQNRERSRNTFGVTFGRRTIAGLDEYLVERRMAVRFNRAVKSRPQLPDDKRVRRFDGF
jgi:hypothetical protein